MVGSGTSGVTTAIELAHHGLKVAIIEAGPFVLTEHVGSGPFANRADFVPKIHDLVRYRTLWTTEAELAAARSGTAETNNNAWALVGGRTVFWGGCTPRFRDEDFAEWPYNADEIRPWYERAERLVGHVWWGRCGGLHDAPRAGTPDGAHDERGRSSSLTHPGTRCAGSCRHGSSSSRPRRSTSTRRS